MCDLRGRSLALGLLVPLLPALLAARVAAAPSPQDSKPAATTVQLKGRGEAAPDLGDVEWVQGKPIKKYKRGETYVICFASPGWLTTPHVLREAAALQEQHAQDKVHVMCLFVPPDPSQEPVEDFMKRRPEAAKLAVASDKGGTLPAFGNLLGQVNIETAVVIDGNGLVAWHGEVFPDLGPALSATLADDSATIETLAAARYKIKNDAKPHVDALTAAMSAGQWDQVVAEVDSLLALDAQDFADIAYMKYQALAVAGKQPEAAAWGRELVGGPLKDDEGQLNALAWWIVDPAGGPPDSARDLELALSAAERACELSSQKDAPLLDTLARAHWRLDHRDEAIELQKKAVKLAFGPEMQATVKKSLDEYLHAPKSPAGGAPKH